MLLRPETAWIAFAAVYAALLLTAAVFDIRVRRIPNWTVAGLLLLFIAMAALGPLRGAWISSLAAFALALAVSAGLYLTGGFGAGDSKLFSAAALFAGLSHLLLYVMATVLVGGAMAVIALLLRPRSAMRALTARGRAEGGSRGIPYGVAIAAGALITAALGSPAGRIVAAQLGL